MRTARFLPLLFAVPLAAPAAAQMTAETQIAATVLAAPEDRRAGARVLGYDGAGKLVVLREGTNDMVCLADTPGDDRFEANCYHTTLEPFMARGRELAAQGMNGEDRSRKRYEEIEAGTLKMPEAPAVNYTLHGSAYDAAANTVAGEYRRQTIYIPYATPESTGLSTKASATEPWIMFPGTPGAHIMITPPRPGR